MNNYKPIDGKIGITSPGPTPPDAKPWVANEVVPAKSWRVNGGFAFYTVAGGTCAASQGPTPTMLVDNTVTWVLVGPVSPFYAQDAAPVVEPGYIALGVDPTFGVGEFRYVKFTGTVHAGDFVIVDANVHTCVQTPAAAPGANKLSILGISMGEQAAGTYGWVMIRGVHDSANVTAGLAVGTLLSGSSIAGRCTQATANYLFDGAVLRVAGVMGCGTVELYWPVCSGR